MAEQERIYRIKYEGVDSAIKSLSDLKDEIAAVKSEQKALDLTTEQGKARKEELLIIEKKLSEEYRNQQKEISNKNKQMNNEADTLEKMRARLSNMYSEYAKIPIGTQAFTDQQKAIKELKDKIDEAEQATGHFQRNVGNYKNGIIDAFQQMGINVADVTDNIKKAKVAMAGMTAATGTASTAMKVLKIALASTGIGLLIVAIGTLIGYFNSAGDRADKFRLIIAPLKDVFYQIQTAVYGLIDGISFVFDWLAKLTGSVSDLGQSIIRLKDAYETSAAALDYYISEKQVEKARKMSEFLQKATKTEEERVKIANEILKIEDNIFERQVKLANDKMKLHELEWSQKTGEINLDEQLIEFYKIKVEQNNLEIESIERKNSITKRTQALLIELGKTEEDEAARNAKIQAEKQKRLSAEYDYKKAINDLAIESKILISNIYKNIEERELERIEKINSRREQVENSINEMQIKISEMFPGQEEGVVPDITDDPEVILTLLREKRKKEIFENTVAAQIDAIKRKAKEEQWTEEQTAKMISEVRLNQLENYKEIMSKTKGLLKENTAAYKVVATSEALISTYLAIAKTLKEPTLPFPANVAMSVIIGAQGLMQVAKINAVKFAKGGIVGGRLHEQGGTKYFGEDGNQFEVERGELITVVNRYDTERLKTLSRLNANHGRPFFASGGIMIPRTDFNNTAATRQMISEVVESIAQIPVVVSEREITTSQRRVSVASKVGDL